MTTTDKSCSVLDRTEYILAACRGKRVLHLGCADSPYTLDKLRSGRLLHTRLLDVSLDLWGLDTDKDAIQVLLDHGMANVFGGRTEDDHLDVPTGYFDLVLAGEIIEHVDNPGLFLQSLKRFLSKDGSVIVTTPNAYCLYRILIYFFRGRDNVHPDHNFWFSRQVLTTLLHKQGYRVREFAFYPIYREEVAGVSAPIALVDAFARRFLPHLNNGLIARCVVERFAS